MKTFLSIIVMLMFLLTSRAVAQTAKTLYVVNSFSETLSKIDLRSGVVTDDIVTLGSLPNDIVIAGEYAWVINSGSSDMYMINLSSYIVESVIDLGAGNNPWSGVMTDDSTMYVTNWLPNSVSRVGLASGTVVANIAAGIGPEGIVRVDNRLYVANSGWNGVGYDPGTVSIVDTSNDSLIATVPVGMNPQELLLDPQGEVNVVCTGDYWGVMGTIYMIDSWTGAVSDSVYTGGSPGRATISASGLMYIAAGGWSSSGEVYLYDSIADTLLHGAANPINTGLGATDVTTDSEGFMYAASMMDNNVMVFDAPDDSTITYNVGSGPTAIAIKEEPWIEIGSQPLTHVVQGGDSLEYSVSLTHNGTQQENVTAFSVLVLPGGRYYDRNPFHGPVDLTVPSGYGMSVDFREYIPYGAPNGRYVLFSVVRDADSRRMAVDSFWVEIVP